MDIEQALQAEHSKAQSVRIAEYIENVPDRFAVLMDLFLGKDTRLAQRAGWAVGHCVDRHPALILPHLESMLARLRENPHVAVRRNAVRALQYVEIPEEWLGEAVDICFSYLTDHKEAIAVRVFALTALGNICRREPDLGNELRLVIEEELPYASAGFKSRAKKILAGLSVD